MSGGWYDVSVSGGDFVWRFMGRMETGYEMRLFHKKTKKNERNNKNKREEEEKIFEKRYPVHL